MYFSQQLFSQEKRVSKSKDCTIQYVKHGIGFLYYNVLDEDNKIKYIGRIESKPSLDEYCTCPDQFHRNSKAFQDSHGYSLNCKHMIQAKKLRGWN